jgi:hypothetical protein
MVALAEIATATRADLVGVPVPLIWMISLEGWQLKPMGCS